MIKDLFDLLAGNHLLHKAVDAAKARLLLGIIPFAVFSIAPDK